MSNFNGTARSNYFKVKNAEVFMAWVETLPDVIILEETATPDGIPMYALLSEDCDTGCFPTWYAQLDEDDVEDELEVGGDEIEIDWKADLGAHLADGEVCVLMEAGAEKARYISGWALAFDNTEKPAVTVRLSDIYARAEAAFGAKPTPAEY